MEEVLVTNMYTLCRWLPKLWLPSMCLTLLCFVGIIVNMVCCC